MEIELQQLALLAAFVSILPYPRTRLFSHAFVRCVSTLLGILVVVITFLSPFASFIKVDMQSRVVSGAIALSTAAPRIGKKILSTNIDTSDLKEALSRDVKENMLDFRFFVLQQFADKYELEEKVDKEDLVVAINKSHSRIRRRHAVGEVIVAVIISGISIVVSLKSVYYGFAVLLTLFSIMFPLSMRLRTLVVDTLAFSASMIDDEENLYDRPPRVPKLQFMESWNQMLLRNEAIIHKLIYVSFAKGEFPIGYERGAELMEEVLNGEKDLDKALDDMVNEEFGEDTTESRWFRRFLKRFLGV